MQDHITKRRSRIPRFLGWTVVTCAVIAPIVYFLFIRGTYTETKCPSNDPKIVALYRANNRLNKALARHDWKWIHDEETRGFEAGATMKPQSYKDMITSLHEAQVPLGRYDLRMISYTMNGDTAETSNCQTARAIVLPFLSHSDTTLHRWIYSGGEWYLDDWGMTNEPEPELSPENKELMRKLYPADSAKWR